MAKSFHIGKFSEGLRLHVTVTTRNGEKGPEAEHKTH